jgi:hypothetical protein
MHAGASLAPQKAKCPAKAGRFLGAGGLEPPKTEVGGFTVPCNCRYATPPEKTKSLIVEDLCAQEILMLAKGIEPSTIRLQVGRSTIELHQQNRVLSLSNFPLSSQADALD